MAIKIWTSVFLLLLTIYDLISQKIPNTVLFSYFLIILTAKIEYDYAHIFQSLLAGLGILALFIFIKVVTKGIGSGDIKLISVLSFSIGFFKVIYSLLFACGFGLLFWFFHQTISAKRKKIPFVPFIASGYFFCDLLNWNI